MQGEAIVGGLLALDIATVTGWAYGRVPRRAMTRLEMAASQPPKPQSGVILVRSKQGIGHFLSEFEGHLSDMLDRLRPAGLIIEAPILPQTTSFDTVRKLMAMAGNVEKLAAQRGIRWHRVVQPSSVKKHFTGSGRAKKPEMIAECQARGWFPLATDDEADALGIWDYGCDMYRREMVG
jgi:Holliday junction resolvasome RuvABC endonuclease subunit